MPPLTGLVELYGPEISWAGQIAVAEINESGGLLGCELKLIIEDDGSMPDTAVAAAERLIDTHCCEVIIGNLLSNSRIAVADRVAAPRRLPYLNFSFYEGSISNRYFFHYAALPNQQIARMIPYMAERFGSKMFFAGNNYEWPRGSIDAAKRSLRALGGEVVGEVYLPLGSPAEPLEALLEDVACSGADVFVPYFAGRDQIELLNRFAKRGLKRKMAVVMGHYDEAMVRFLEPQVRVGLYSSNTYFMEVNTKVNQRYLQRLRAHSQVDDLWPGGRGVLTNFGEGTYCCVRAYAQAVEQAGTTEPEAVVAALEQGAVESCQGLVRMDPHSHHAEVNSYLARCRLNGTFEIIERFGRIAPEIPARYRVEPRRGLHSETQAPLKLQELPAAGSTGTIDGLFRRILDLADVAVIATDVEGVILQANLGACRMFGYQPEEFIGLSVHLLLPPHQRQHHAAALREFEQSAALEMPMGHQGEISGYRKDGTPFPAEAAISKFRDAERTVLVATLRDITVKRQAEQELTWRATHDPLTRLPNRALIRERLEHALERSERSRQCIALLFIDLDHFKLINDTYGHDAGDRLLIRVANILLEHVRAGDTVGRLGGDEFVVLCEQVERIESIEHLAERINDALRLPIALEGRELVCTASIGLTLGQGGSSTVEQMLRDADAAMYVSKEQGRDSWRRFSTDLTAQARKRLDIVNGLRQAIEREELHLVFQPILATQSGRIQGAEALLRWQSPDGPVSPAVFIPIAEQSGAILPIGRWVFEQACATQARLHQRNDGQSPYLSVNLSTVQLNDERIVRDFAAIIEQTGADPNGLVLELTETSLFADVEKNLRVLRALADLGLRVAVDDFGTGYSSLLQLLRLPVSMIKIDREFIDGIDKHADARLIVSAIIKMGKALNKGLIAEGVENDAQLFELQALRCQWVQGFHLYRPMPEQALCEALTHERGAEAAEAKLYYVVYVSRARDEMSEAQLNALLEVSRRNNREIGVTGFLIYQAGYFMQLLEGQRDIVDTLMERIASDPRHQKPSVIIRGYAHRRLFNDWSMGFWNMDFALAADIDFMDWQKRTLSLLEASQDARFCYALFEALSRTN
ncbi:Bacteriophytochrome cph2 [Thiorhodovibrio winogradskyi]|uniref:Bacteriophytochrome cph2 n=2 Tax=Thiorhodovibrio winogradskyi TaxID=77007 RepID=A0ABZ0SDW0_9GAMM